MTTETREAGSEQVHEHDHKHLDDTAPMGTRPEETGTEVETTSTHDEPGGFGRWGSVMTGVAMLVAGLLIGWLVFSTPEEPEAAAAAPAESEPEAAPETVIEPTDEPVADVAEALLPSVVQIETGGGLGSGVIYDADGLILTAAHVVAGNDTVGVRLSDGTQYEGQVVGGDTASDIAVVELEATGLPAAALGSDEDVRVGQLAVAMGSPFGLDSTVTSGIVSAVDQAVGSGQGPQAAFQSLIQTDAAINPGNSGGALANRSGEVIGINVSIYSTTGGNDGVGFAVPIGLASELAESIVSGDPIEAAQLGVLGSDATGDEAGAVIEEVQPGSAAAAAGLETGDVVLSIDGTRVTGIADLAAQVRSFRPDDTVTLQVVRNGEEVELDVTLGTADEATTSEEGEAPAPGGDGAPVEGDAALGIMGGDATGDVTGAVVAQVQPGSAAAEAGLQPGDVIVSIDGVGVNGIAELAEQIGGHEPGDEVTLGVVRAGAQGEVAVTLGSAS